MKTLSTRFKALLLAVVMAAVVCCPVDAAPDSSSLYSYVMSTYSEEFKNVDEARDKLQSLQLEYKSILAQNVLADTYEGLKEYAGQVEAEINTVIDNNISTIELCKQEVRVNVEQNLLELSPKQLSSLCREYESYDDEINGMLEEKTSLSTMFGVQDYKKIPTEYLEVSMQEQQEIISYSSTSADTYLGELSELKHPFNCPARVTSPVGYRVHPIYGNVRFHSGTDYAVSSGTELYALFNGTVVIAQYSKSYGNNVKIDCGNGIIVHYAHLSECIAKVGDVVKQGDLIGLSGSTGDSTGPHLHLALYIKENVYNVEELFKQ